MGLIITLMLGGWGLHIDGAQATELRADSLQTSQPKAALWRSLVVPGWGQIYNGKPAKALLFGTAVVGGWGGVLMESRPVGQEIDKAQRQEQAARRNTRFLLVFLIYTVAALDAYIDAHLADVELSAEGDWAQRRVSMKWTKELF